MAFGSETMGLFPIICDLVIAQGKETKSMFCFSSAFPVSYLFADRPSHRHGERPDVPAAQVLPFPLVTEEFQFTLLLIIQTVAVAYLDRQTHTSTYSCKILICYTDIEI